MRRLPGARIAMAMVALVGCGAVCAHAQTGGFVLRDHLRPSKRPSIRSGCELPATFYSAAHRAGEPPCCASAYGMCPGGVACPAGGMCADGRACSPGSGPGFRNVILMIADDMGDCHFGHAGECRTTVSGSPAPAPVTPNLDLLAGHGTVFPVAHNTASWCFPSLTTILTGRYQRSFEGVGRPAATFGSVFDAVRSAGNDPMLPADPYEPSSTVGAPCTLLGGKIGGSVGNVGYDLRVRTSERSLGRIECGTTGSGQPPDCGSATQTGYRPREVSRLGDVFAFLESMFYRIPGTTPAEYRVHPFFVWYAPRIPHRPLRADPSVDTYLFGQLGTFPRGGLFDLGSLCVGGSCPPAIQAFMVESNAGTGPQMYANLWWMDAGLGEIRKFLARASEPHCIGPDGMALFDAPQGSCPGTWADTVTPNLANETVVMFLADNGWFLPGGKHSFTENGYRTRLIVFDPQASGPVGWDASQEVIPPPQESPALVHAVDLAPTVVGYVRGSAPGTEPCPEAYDGSRCDGKDLRAHLETAAGGPAAPESLRHALCGHETLRPTTPTNRRYLLTREGSVGRCTDLSAASCLVDGDCAGGFCLGGRCMASTEPACTTSAQCPAGATCLAGRCRSGPSCIEDADCGRIFPGGSTACVEKATRWCRNAPGVRCSTRDDCPVCPGGVPCGRTCEPRRLKFYVTQPGSYGGLEMSDLFLDPDERGLHAASPGTVAGALSDVNGPYGPTMRRANCCLDAWWPEVAASGTLCTGGCPLDLVCNE